ncbi:MAG: PSD1 and planctomycete cytochrome C domain-containing protein [Planctomycetaceae bacterium]
MRTVICLLAVVNLPAAFAQQIDFNREIKPILSDKCYTCHGPDAETREGGGDDGLRFDTKEGAFADLGGHFAIVAGDLDASELISRIKSADADLAMPPPSQVKQLTAAEKQKLAQWVKQGANWSGHWAYEPPVKSQRPPGNWIDGMVRQQLSSRGLKQASRAKKRILIRRAFFDLIGLPPSPAEVDAFLNDQSDSAWENLIDRLLSSPHFGERMAIYWLDLVRYADTVGYHGDQDVSVSPFRDYVIDAFNSNMPFDQFTREQLAGDLLANPTQSQLVASGYNKLGMMSAEGGAQPKEYLTKYASDRVRTASTVWLGSTLGCAECHDHKFDPFTQKDFYQFASFFADIKERGLYAGANRDGQWGPTVKVADEQLPKLLQPIDEKIERLTGSYEAANIADGLKKWESGFAESGTAWHYLQVEEPTALRGTKLSVESDQSVLASGPHGGTNVYTMTVQTRLSGITGFRVEALPHETLPGKGPGRAGNGNFVLSEFKVFAEGEKGKKTPLKFVKAEADFEQADGKGNPYEGWKAIAAIDSDAKGSTWGWAVMPQFGKSHELVMQLDKSFSPTEPTRLRIEIHQNHKNPGHTIGRFRLSATTDARISIHPRHALPENIQKLLATKERNEKQQAEIAAYYRTIAPELAEVRKRLAAAKAERKSTEERHTRRTLITVAVKPRTMRVLARGNWMDENGEVVTPSVPHFLPQLPSNSDALATRLDLANWLTSSENPLTARVFVNRLWKLLFGTGLSKVLDDVGSQGEFPTHPKLLDELALEFTESGWNIKHMIKVIVMSETYQQSSLLRDELAEIDPYNRLLARQSRFRIDAELVRDNALAVSGLLVRQIGGRSVKPYQPPGLLRHLNFPRRKYKHDSGENQYRRGVYTHWQRQFLHPAMKSFDAPAREECTAERPRSNTPLAALVLLNDPSYVEASRVFAESILSDPKFSTDELRIDAIFERALSRAANERERTVLIWLLGSQRKRFQAAPEAAKELLSVGERPVGDAIDPVELAALLSVTRTVFNMHEFITRN